MPEPQTTELRPRPATPAEAMIWAQFRRLVDQQLRPHVQNFLNGAVAAATMQQFFNNYNLPIVAFSNGRQSRMDGILERYNILDRLITAAENEKYFVTIVDGDIAIWASPQMNREQIQDDIYPGAMGIAWIPVMIGIALVVGAIVTVEALDYNTRAEDRQMQKDMVAAAQVMATKPPEQQRAFKKMLDANQATFNKVKTETGSGLLGMLVGKETGSALAIALVIGVVAWAFGQTAPALAQMGPKKKAA